MPAPRSILIDIHDRGLNPQVAHKSVDSSGRIKSATSEPEQIPDKPKLALKKLTKEAKKDKDETVVVSGETTAEEVTNEGAGSVELSQQEETVVVAPSVVSRRGKRNTSSNT